jgi:hypothetical protein
VPKVDSFRNARRVRVATIAFVLAVSPLLFLERDRQWIFWIAIAVISLVMIPLERRLLRCPKCGMSQRMRLFSTTRGGVRVPWPWPQRRCTRCGERLD